MTKAKKEKKSKAETVLGYLAGSIILWVVAITVIPAAIPYVSGVINKKVAKISNSKKTEDEWGPVIEKKEQRVSDSVDGE